MRARAPGGFTLVELLIALALAATVTLLLMGGMRFSALALDRSTTRADAVEARRSLVELLRRDLGAALSAPLAPNQPALVGGPQRVAFLTLAESGGAGLWLVQIAAETDGGVRRLVLSRRALGGSPAPEQRAVLAADLRDFRLAYFGAPTPRDDKAWQTSWQGPRYPPDLVRIAVDAGDGMDWPPILVRLWTAQ